MVYKLDDSTGTNKITWNLTDNILQEESVSKEANLTLMPLFGSDSNLTDVFDFGGVTRTITITAVRKDTPANIAAFVQGTLLALMQGDQSPTQNYPYTYTSTLLGTVKVKFMSIDLNYVAGDPRRLRYTIKMVESSTVG